MKRKVTVLILTAVLFVTAASAQLPVFDAANLANAIERLIQLEKQYVQLVETYKQIVRQYEHMLWMAKQVPDLLAYRFVRTPWRLSQSTNTYGTSGPWTRAITTGEAVIDGYRQATQRLETYGAALARIPADQFIRAKTDYATVELADAANIHGIELLGNQRAKTRLTEEAIAALERASLSTEDRFNTEIAVLNKINAATVMALRAGQDTNQLLVSLLERQITDSKARRDAETSAINANIAFWTRAMDAGMEGIRGTTATIRSFRIP